MLAYLLELIFTKCSNFVQQFMGPDYFAEVMKKPAECLPNWKASSDQMVWHLAKTAIYMLLILVSITLLMWILIEIFAAIIFFLFWLLKSAGSS